MKYITFDIKAENKHSKGVKVSRPIMFELHDEFEDGFAFRFRDMKLKHCTCSLRVHTDFNIFTGDGVLSQPRVAAFLSGFFKYYYTFAVHENNVAFGRSSEGYKDYHLEELVTASDFIDRHSMCLLKEELDDNSISPTVIKGIIEALDALIMEFASDENSDVGVNSDVGEKIKSVQKNRKVIDFQYQYFPDGIFNGKDNAEAYIAAIIPAERKAQV
jgi:hypothetical protein